MNQHLQNILNIIQPDESLTAEQKDAILRSLKDANKEFDITAFKLDRTEKVKRTTAILLEETIEELEQKRKAVEAQNKELEIETSIERVRAQAMAMHQTTDLDKVNKELFNQLQWLKVDGLSGVSIYFFDEEGEVKVWDLSSPGNTGDPNSYTFKFSSKKYPVLGELWQHYKNSPDYFTLYYPLEKLKAAIPEFREIDTVIANAIKEAVNSGSLKHQWNAFGKITNGVLGIDLMSPPSDNTKPIVLKMAGAFNLAYKRFLDLQKAEAQSRESQIQLALERVRARTMAMHQSNELADTASILFQQIKELGFETWSCGFCIWTKNDLAEVWMAADSGGLLPPMMIPYKEEPTHAAIYKASLRGEPAHDKIWEGKELEKHYAFLKTIPSVKTAIDLLEKSGLTLPSKQCYYVGFFEEGYLLLITKEPNEGLKDLSKRLASVFDLTYTRFLDLQKAEAQAKESQIEAALERVRSRTLAMQKSEELAETSAVLFKQLIGLGISPNRLYIGIMKDDAGKTEFWITDEDGSKVSMA